MAPGVEPQQERFTAGSASQLKKHLLQAFLEQSLVELLGLRRGLQRYASRGCSPHPFGELKEDVA
jgi:hypothetical protein